MGIWKKVLDGALGAESSQQERSPRVRLTPLHRIQFRLLEGSAPSKLSNLSTTGMGLFREPNDAWEFERDYEGLLTIDHDEVRIAARVRHLNDQLVGCEFVQASPELRRVIEKYLRVEILAMSLRPVDRAFLQPHPRGQVHWFTDGQANEIHFVEDGTGLIEFHVSFMGNYVEWDAVRGLRVGIVKEAAADHDFGGHKASSLILFGTYVAPEVVALTHVLLKNVERINETSRVRLLEKLAVG